jgi:hypothetical protein
MARLPLCGKSPIFLIHCTLDLRPHAKKRAPSDFDQLIHTSDILRQNRAGRLFRPLPTWMYPATANLAEPTCYLLGASQPAYFATVTRATSPTTATVIQPELVCLRHVGNIRTHHNCSRCRIVVPCRLLVPAMPVAGISSRMVTRFLAISTVTLAPTCLIQSRMSW